MASVKDITGRRYGKLTVVRQMGCDIHGHTLWEVKCDCGTAFLVSKQNLTNGNTKSCGCWRKR